MAKPILLTHPVAAMRTTLLHGQPIPLWGTGGWFWMFATAVGWLLLGVLAFRVGSRVAKRHGRLARY